MRTFRAGTVSGVGPGVGEGACATCAGVAVGLAVACDVGDGEPCATAGLFAFPFGCGCLAGGNRTLHKIRTAADAARATMNLCCCCILVIETKSLRHLCVLCVSAVNPTLRKPHPRDTENAQITQSKK